MQEGAIINQENYPMKNVANESREKILASFLKLYYAQRDDLPSDILLPFEPDDYEALSAWLKHRTSLPQRGERSKLLAMAKRNAFHLIEEKKLAHLRKANRTIFPIQELKESLAEQLPAKWYVWIYPQFKARTVSSAVYFETAKPKRSSIVTTSFAVLILRTILPHCRKPCRGS
jgi:excinuclease ABC subunit C